MTEVTIIFCLLFNFIVTSRYSLEPSIYFPGLQTLDSISLPASSIITPLACPAAVPGSIPKIIIKGSRQGQNWQTLFAHHHDLPVSQ